MRVGRARFPGLIVGESELRAFVNGLTTDDDRVRLHAEDLYLASACATGVQQAVEVLEQTHFLHVPSYIRRFCTKREVIDEVMQKLRWKMLLDRPPKIATYSGTGPLDAWIRISAVRIAIDQVSAQDSSVAHEAEGALLDMVGGADPEVETLRRHYGPALQQSLHAAIEALSPQHRILLWLHYGQRLNIDRLGRIYGVHRATAARWVMALRRDLLGEVRNRFREHWQVSDSEFGSLYRVIEQDLRISFRQLRATLSDADLDAGFET